MILDHTAGLYEACRGISPINPDYANLPIEEGFDFSRRLGGIPFDRLYLVVFRSVRRPDADLKFLKEHDDRAYEAALESGGLLRYFKGEMNERRECLSFCLWESREQAVAAAGGASHRTAANLAAQMYESHGLERYELTKNTNGLRFRRLDASTGTPHRSSPRRQTRALSQQDLMPETFTRSACSRFSGERTAV
jgi:hypothetical protein